MLVKLASFRVKKADCIIFVLLEKMDPIQGELKQQTDLYRDCSKPRRRRRQRGHVETKD